MPGRYAAVLLLCLAALVAGCGGRPASSFHIRQDVDFGYIKRVAVLPMENLTNERFAGDVVRQAVISELLTTGLVDVVIPGEAIAAMEKQGIKNVSALTAAQIKAIGNALKVEAIIIGSVEKFGEERIGNIAAPAVTITLMMADANSGSIIWSVTRTRGGAGFMARHLGARTPTMSETLLQTVRESIRTLTLYSTR